MLVERLIGLKVWVKLPGVPEQMGFISSIPHSVNVGRIEDSIRASTFRIDIAAGDVVEIEGCFISRIALSAD